MKAYLQWQYDEFKHLATDFHDPQQVETYDARQHTNNQWCELKWS